MSMGIASDLATVETIGPNEMFGELSLIDKSSRPATTKAAGDVVIYITVFNYNN
jgi:CRP-like cAMP-binding protein